MTPTVVTWSGQVMLDGIIFGSLLILCCGYALLRGGAPERIGAILYMLADRLTVFAASQPATRWGSVEFGILVVDTAMLVALLVLAVCANRFWPLWVAALQAVGTAGHAIKLADPEVIRWAYAFALAFWSYPMLLMLVLGTWNHQRRLARFGGDPSWSNFSRRSLTPPETGPTS